ncbi:PQQ-dependent sugar dehydrogenase [Aliiglaciecola sp. CAU 1673]|uniref:PQQ-dependent sugar dehydrogenase n=1 Tax=Aliiglaciecola sp. CAU 1673 TaxID=3032595 RepID=UPI0023DAA047|nr:PQQ-dependent sugar dehydrogenase [Aliiglaciecola sp. CAU 1673]MDF2178640.1 PQQ-dependent sugar dehydrogenase [Aliiglaciecola sp. CAU 1673]
MKKLLTLYAALISPVVFANPLANLTLPEGFQIEVYANDVKNARQMAMGDKGTLFVGSRNAGVVNAVVDVDGDFKADKVIEIASGLTMPSGIAFKDGNLYVAAISQVLVYEDIENRLDNPPAAKVLIGNLPTDVHHGWKYLGFGPDGWLYVPVGAPCNICQTLGDDKFNDERYASILKFDPKTKEQKIVARGVRNSVGFDWHPSSKEFWFSDNGRDWLGDELPPCEINKVTKEGEHFGYPYFHGGLVADPEFGMDKKASDYVQPQIRLDAHVAPLGIKFYRGSQFPKEYTQALFVAEHGSWNRADKSGYKVMVAKSQADGSLKYEDFITGWLNEKDEVSGRPVDVLNLADGSILVSDDFANVIYRVTYRGASE